MLDSLILIPDAGKTNNQVKMKPGLNMQYSRVVRAGRTVRSSAWKMSNQIDVSSIQLGCIYEVGLLL